MARKRKQESAARTVAERLRELLAEAGITQGELARCAGVSAQVVSRLLAEGNADMTLGIACRLCWAMGHGPDVLAAAVFAEWQDQPSVTDWQHQELDRRRLQQKLDAINQRIAAYRALPTRGDSDAAQLTRRWADGMIRHWQEQAKDLEARKRNLEGESGGP